MYAGNKLGALGLLLSDALETATGAAVFHGAHIGRESTERVHTIVHLRTRLEAQTTVPIAWIAVGSPAQILPPDKHDEIWAGQKPLNFPEWVYGFDRGTPNLMVHVTGYLSESLAGHSKDEPA